MYLQLLRLLKLVSKIGGLLVIATHARLHFASRGNFRTLGIEITKCLILQHDVNSLLEVVLTFEHLGFQLKGIRVCKLAPRDC